MTKKLTTEEQQELSWEEAVSRYLEDNPDYFQRYPDLLADLRLRHEPGGRAVSLIEYQVHTLRRRNHDLGRQLEQLVQIARDNDALTVRLHHFALAVIECRALDDVLDCTYELLRQEFRVDAAAILLQSEAARGRREHVAAGDRRLKALLAQLGDGKPRAGARLEESLMRYLFGEDAAEIKSCALVALAAREPLGVLALGSQDARRFAAGLGTVYLSRLGELLAHAIAARLVAT